MSKVKVFKFGGASVKDIDGIKNVASIIKTQETPILVVVSAMGKTTNALEGIVNAYFNQTGEAFQLYEAVRNQHLEVCNSLFGPNSETANLINDIFVEIEWVIEDELHDGYDYIYDQIVSVGELASSTILANYLKKENLSAHWQDARDVIITDETYRDGKVNWDETTNKVNSILADKLVNSNIIVTQGFIGGTPDNNTTTLGREGSDYSAAILSFALSADSMSVWKDVPGILTGDPRIFDEVTKIDQMSYREAIEMTYYGAKVIHPKTIKPLQNKNIPMYVKSFINPNGAGTVINNELVEKYPPVIVLENNQVLIKIATKDFSFVAEHHLCYIFEKFAASRIKINMMRNTAISFSVSVRDTRARLQALIKELEKEFNVEVQDNLQLITIRHFEESVIDRLTKDKNILLEERSGETIRFVVESE